MGFTSQVLRTLSLFPRLMLIALMSALLPVMAHAAQRGEVAELGRVVERLGIVLVAGLCLTFGYALFKITAKESGELFAQRGEWSLKLSQVGPGVFFALFGSSILVVALIIQPIITDKHVIGAQPPNVSEVTLRGAFGVESGGKELLSQTLSALNTTINLAEISERPLDDAERQRLRTAASQLNAFRPIVVDTLLGHGRYEEWHGLRVQLDRGINLEQRFRNDPDLRSHFNETDKLLSSTLD